MEISSAECIQGQTSSKPFGDVFSTIEAVGLSLFDFLRLLNFAAHPSSKLSRSHTCGANHSMSTKPNDHTSEAGDVAFGPCWSTSGAM